LNFFFENNSMNCVSIDINFLLKKEISNFINILSQLFTLSKLFFIDLFNELHFNVHSFQKISNVINILVYVLIVVFKVFF